MKTPHKPGRYNINSLKRALRILELFAEEEKSLGLTELGKTMGWDKSVIHRLVTGLRESGHVEQDPERDSVTHSDRRVLLDAGYRSRRIRLWKTFLLHASVLLATSLIWAQGLSLPNPETSNWATVEAHSNGVPVYAYGTTYIYGVSPDFFTDLILQEDNNLPARKIQPKKSWEIKSNLFGSTPAREPRTAVNDDQPLLGIHLIDGDVRSCWASRGQNQPTFEDVWIRIDLPYEAAISNVVLVGHPEGMGQDDPALQVVKVGQAFPRKLEVKLSRDAWHWSTVYRASEFTPQDVRGRNPISFSPELAKQIWIIGSGLPVVHYFGHSFSVAEVEVLDTKGNNLALLSRGAGVQVSSTHTGFGMDRFTQDWLWPTQYDLGFKWSRVGYDMSLFQWAYVEREKGELRIDSKAEAALTEAVKNGLEVILCLDKGNWHYAPSPRSLDRTKDLMETYSNNPGTPHGWQDMLLDHPPQLEGFLNYVRFMVRHFKDRVRYFEIWNEWGPYSYEGAGRYVQFLKAAIPVIRSEYPQAKIIPASPGWLQSVPDRDRHGFSFFKALADAGLLSQVDALGFHPFYDPSHQDPYLLSFVDDFREFKKYVEQNGFKGNEYIASEWDFFTAYPHSDLRGYVEREKHSEMQKAIYSSRLSTIFAYLGIVNLWNETFQTMQTMRGLSLFRNAFSNEVICPTQPEVFYYMARTLSTVLADAKGADFPVTLTEARSKTGSGRGSSRLVEHYGFLRNGGEKLIAFWLTGYADENGHDYANLAIDLAVPGVSGEGASVIDVLNGVEKPLKVERASQGITIRKLRARSWPCIVRLHG